MEVAIHSRLRKMSHLEMRKEENPKVEVRFIFLFFERFEVDFVKDYFIRKLRSPRFSMSRSYISAKALRRTSGSY
jgi:hypothetical protein